MSIWFIFLIAMIVSLLVLPFVFAGLFFFPIRHKSAIAILFSLVIFGFSAIHIAFFAVDNNTIELSQSSFFLTFKSDYLSSLFTLLTAFLLVVVFVLSHNRVTDKFERYASSFFALTGLIFGFFFTADIITFYVCFELSLLPLFLIIATFGSDKRMKAAFKLLLYTIFGSLFILLAIIYIIITVRDTNISIIVAEIHNFPIEVQLGLWLAFMVGFFIKIPVVPVHTWLPLAHVEAPMGGSIFLAGIIIKMAGYGILKIILPGFQVLNTQLQLYVFVFGIVSIIYASLLILNQTDIKKMIAYSSVAHMGYVLISLFAFNNNGVYGAIFQMISHGLISGGLFACVGLVYDQTHTRDIEKYGDLNTKMPKLSTLFAILTFANIGLPTTSGFIGEFMPILATAQSSLIVAGIMTTGAVLSALYMLKLLKNMMFGTYKGTTDLVDISIVDTSVLLVICVLVIFFGIFPDLLIPQTVLIEILQSLDIHYAS